MNLFSPPLLTNHEISHPSETLWVTALPNWCNFGNCGEKSVTAERTKGNFYFMFGLISEEGCCDRGEIDWNCPPRAEGGQERLYDRTRSSRSVFVTALSGHFPKTIGYGAGSLKRNEEAVQSIPYDH
ncbi:hypothetical protein Salat_2988700 [Sesamum alatum]|uniref:Uncharacterized protein n=1 Tax=Sesamum alatum TaxID=300844 RepID=A0AAE2C866_9LAMI|nr:hypothetical protein Salat_2988700 [Sesamum alatum]